MFSGINKQFTLLLMLISSFASAQTYHISGKVSGFKNGTKVSLMNVDEDTKIISAILKDGSFNLSGTLKNGPLYLDVVLSDAGRDYNCTVFAGAGNVSITGDKKDFPYDVKITGTEEQAKFNVYQSKLKPYNMKLHELMQAYMKAKPNSTAQRNAAIANNKVADEMHTADKKLLLANPNTYYAADNLYDHLPQINRDEVSRIYNKLSAPIKNSTYGKRIQVYLNTHGKGILVGDKIYDFEAYDAAGKPHKLSGYLGKYILLDLSSVHCGPCVESDDELRMLSKKYKSQLNIVTLSADKKSEWLQGIKNENVTWVSLNDGQGLRGKTQLKYDAPGFPGFYIISPTGVILETWAGYEKLKTSPGYLEKRLAKHLKKG